MCTHEPDRRFNSLALVAALCALIFGHASAVAAQTPARPADSRSSWGVVGSFAPARSWQTIPTFELIFQQEGPIRISGADFSIGIARGRDLGGDWGVSYVRKTVQDSSQLGALNVDCFDGVCMQSGSFQLTRGVVLNGVEVHKYIPLATIRRRVQIGLNVAGGAGKFEGEVETHDSWPVPIFAGNRLTYESEESVTTRPASEDLVMTEWFPLGKLQAAVGVIVAPGFKLRVAGGFDFPGYSKFSVTGVYLFGR
jgi:hypothetical protein